ncbi:AI-2E family transporter [Persephonella sp.]
MGSNYGQIGNIFFFLFLSFFLFLGYLLFLPFLKVIILSILITIIFYPVKQRLDSKLKKPILSSLLSTVIVFLFIIVPSIVLIAFFTNQVISLYPVIMTAISEGHSIEYYINQIPILSSVHKLFLNSLQAFHIDIDLNTVLKNLLSNIANFLIEQGKSLFINITFLIVGIGIMLVTIFFLFKDGEVLYHRVLRLIPLPEKDKNFLLSKTYTAIQGVVLGSVLTAIAQGILSFIGYFFAGLEFSLFWAFVTFIAAFLPIGGASLVWIPIAVYLFISKGLLVGFLFALWGTFVISLVDNIIKPVVIGDKTNIHPVILFFAILGGLNIFGFIGIFLAPIIIVLIDNMLHLYSERFSSQD